MTESQYAILGRLLERFIAQREDYTYVELSGDRFVLDGSVEVGPEEAAVLNSIGDLS